MPSLLPHTCLPKLDGGISSMLDVCPTHTPLLLQTSLVLHTNTHHNLCTCIYIDVYTNFSYAVLGVDQDLCSAPAEEAHSRASCSSSQFFCSISGFSNAVFPFFRFLGKVQPGISECSPMTTGLAPFFEGTWDSTPFLLPTVGLTVLQGK